MCGLSSAMIAVSQGHTRFHYRVSGVAVKGSQVLLHKTETDDFWSLPGGRVELLEPAAEALHREMGEELCIESRVGRLLWVIENLFDFGGEKHHELGLCFLMDFASDSLLYASSGPFFGREDDWGDGRQALQLTFQWFPRDREVLENLPLYPAFLQQALINLPEVPEHIVHYDPGFVK
jgi:ADP-ribose pyrophosphatase YjhB (NUDIX family)